MELQNNYTVHSNKVVDRLKELGVEMSIKPAYIMDDKRLGIRDGVKRIKVKWPSNIQNRLLVAKKYKETIVDPDLVF